jgi:aryl-alcohol dehydrogenase-like predicted oxidoreductase
VKGKPLPSVAQEIGAATWAQVFLKYLLGNPAITAVIPGTNKVEHLADNLGAGRGPLPTAKQRQELVKYFERL